MVDHQRHLVHLLKSDPKFRAHVVKYGVPEAGPRDCTELNPGDICMQTKCVNGKQIVMKCDGSGGCTQYQEVPCDSSAVMFSAKGGIVAKQHRLGKRPAVFDSRTLRFSTYLKANLPAPPDTMDWGKNVKSWPMYSNDEYGDCTCAAAGHLIENWTAAVGKGKVPTDKQVLNFYEHFTTPGPDNGCEMLSVLKYWRSTGLAGDRISAFAQLEPRNITEVKDAISIFGGCYIGVELPKFALAGSNLLAIPWVVPPQGPTGDAAPDPNGGHCVPAVGYDSRNLYVVTWGAVKIMSWQFYSAYSDESYVALSNDFLSNKKTPDGFDLTQLKHDLADIERIPAGRAAISRRR